MGRKTNSNSLRLKKTNKDYNDCWYGDILYSGAFSRSLNIQKSLTHSFDTADVSYPRYSLIGGAKRADILLCYLDPKIRKEDCDKYNIKFYGSISKNFCGKTKNEKESTTHSKKRFSVLPSSAHYEHDATQNPAHIQCIEPYSAKKISFRFWSGDAYEEQVPHLQRQKPQHLSAFSFTGPIKTTAHACQMWGKKQRLNTKRVVLVHSKSRRKTHIFFFSNIYNRVEKGLCFHTRHLSLGSQKLIHLPVGRCSVSATGGVKQILFAPAHTRPISSGVWVPRNPCFPYRKSYFFEKRKSFASFLANICAIRKNEHISGKYDLPVYPFTAAAGDTLHTVPITHHQHKKISLLSPFAEYVRHIEGDGSLCKKNPQKYVYPLVRDKREKIAYIPYLSRCSADFWGNVVSLCFMKSRSEKASAHFLCAYVSYFLQRKINFRTIKSQLLHSLHLSRMQKNRGPLSDPYTSFFAKNKSKIVGIRISCCGRVGGRSKKAQRSRKDTFMWGETGLHVFSKRLDFAQTTAETSFGVVGIAVWICYKGCSV